MQPESSLASISGQHGVSTASIREQRRGRSLLRAHGALLHRLLQQVEDLVEQRDVEVWPEVPAVAGTIDGRLGARQVLARRELLLGLGLGLG